jgi:hypothetical protein
MGLLDKVVSIEKRLEKLASRKDVPAAPIEIRRALLDDIEEHVTPAGRSRRVFPYTRVTVDVLPPADARAAFEAVLNPDEGLAQAVRERLAEAGCDRIGKLEFAVNVLEQPRPGWPEGTRFQVTYERAAAPAAAEGRVAPVPTGPAQLTVLDGEAAEKTYTLSGERVNVGRQEAVTDKERRIVRRNQVVFLDTEGETNQTVSRAQAHITFAPPAEYRLFDDHSAYGTRIIRQGTTIDLPSGSPRGVRLQHGDEIYFGRARVLFEVT